MHNYDERHTCKIYCSFVFGQANFQWSAGGTGKKAWRNIKPPGSLHMNTSNETIVCVRRFYKKKVFGLFTVGAGSPARHRHGRQKVSMPECDLTGRLDERSTITLLLSVLKIAILMLVCQHPQHSTENELAQNWNSNHKSASFIVIMHLHEGLTHIQSQITHQLLFGESFTLIFLTIMCFGTHYSALIR